MGFRGARQFIRMYWWLLLLWYNRVALYSCVALSCTVLCSNLLLIRFTRTSTDCSRAGLCSYIKNKRGIPPEGKEIFTTRRIIRGCNVCLHHLERDWAAGGDRIPVLSMYQQPKTFPCCRLFRNKTSYWFKSRLLQSWWTKPWHLPLCLVCTLQMHLLQQWGLHASVIMLRGR